MNLHQFKHCTSWPFSKHQTQTNKTTGKWTQDVELHERNCTYQNEVKWGASKWSAKSEIQERCECEKNSKGGAICG